MNDEQCQEHYASKFFGSCSDRKKMSPKLIGLTGPSKGMTVILDENECSIGRAPSNQLCLGGDLVSRQHCVIRKVGNQFVIEDLSTNGTFVNNEPVKKRALAHFDHLTVGDSVFIFLIDEGEISPPTSFVRFSDATTAIGATTQRRPEDVLYLDPAKVEAALAPSASLAGDLNELLKISRAINAVRQPRALALQLLDSEEHTSELQSRGHLVCRLLLEKKKK